MARETLQDLGAPELLDQITKPLGIGTPASDWESQLNKLYYGDQRYRFNDTEDLAEFFAKHGLNTKHGLAAAPFTMAANERTFNPKKQFAFTLKGLLRQPIKNYNAEINSFRQQLEDPDRYMNLEIGDLANRYQEVLHNQYTAMQGVNELIVSYRRFTSPRQLNTFLLRDKDIRGPLSKIQMRGLVNEQFIPKKLSTNAEFFKKLRRANPNINQRKLRQVLNSVEERFNNVDINSDIELIDYYKE